MRVPRVRAWPDPRPTSPRPHRPWERAASWTEALTSDIFTQSFPWTPHSSPLDYFPHLFYFSPLSTSPFPSPNYLLPSLLPCTSFPLLSFSFLLLPRLPSILSTLPVLPLQSFLAIIFYSLSPLLFFSYPCQTSIPPLYLPSISPPYLLSSIYVLVLAFHLLSFRHYRSFPSRLSSFTIPSLLVHLSTLQPFYFFRPS